MTQRLVQAVLRALQFPPLTYCARCAQHHKGKPCPPVR